MASAYIKSNLDKCYMSSSSKVKDDAENLNCIWVEFKNLNNSWFYWFQTRADVVLNGAPLLKAVEIPTTCSFNQMFVWKNLDYRNWRSSSSSKIYLKANSGCTLFDTLKSFYNNLSFYILFKIITYKYQFEENTNIQLNYKIISVVWH